MKRILCLAAAAALLFALTSCARERSVGDILREQYGDAYSYENGEHGFIAYRSIPPVSFLSSSRAERIDDTLQFELIPTALQYDMREGNHRGSMSLVYEIENNTEWYARVLDDEVTIQQLLDGEWYTCYTSDGDSIFSGQDIPPGSKAQFTRSLAFEHADFSENDKVFYKYINFPDGRYRIIHEVYATKCISLEFDLTYEDGMCYLHVVEDE